MTKYNMRIFGVIPFIKLKKNKKQKNKLAVKRLKTMKNVMHS